MVRELPQSSAFTLDDEEDVLELEHLVAKPRVRATDFFSCSTYRNCMAE